MSRGGGGIGAAERGEAGSGSGSGSGFGRAGSALRGLVGRWPDAEVVLQGGMSEGLRDWDLWCVYYYSVGYLVMCVLGGGGCGGVC